MTDKAPTYEKLRAALSTGDIVLFSGTSPISRIIRYATKSPWSHVGMVVRDEVTDTVFVWESTTLSNVADVERQAFVKGVQLTLLSERCAMYEGAVAVRRLLTSTGDSFSLTRTELLALAKIRREFTGRPYETDLAALARSASPSLSAFNRQDLASLFCSEMIAEPYKAWSLLPADVPSSRYTPAFFGRRRVPLLRSAVLSRHAWIVPAKTSTPPTLI